MRKLLKTLLAIFVLPIAVNSENINKRIIKTSTNYGQEMPAPTTRGKFLVCPNGKAIKKKLL